VTSFDTSPQLNVWRALLALAVVFVMLATSGWTALRNQRGATPLQASLSAWEHGRIGGHRLPDPQSEPTKLARFFT
jgi:anti-sigma-K factor RskA